MLSFSQILPAAIRQRPVFRIALFFLIFGIFLVLFLPPTGTPSFFVNVHVPNFFTPNTPLHIPTPSPDPTPPRSTSHRNRIKAKRPSNRPGRKGDVWSQRADAVRDAFLHAYKSYLTHAAPHDELRPLSKAPINIFNGWSLSIIESLDTLWLMDLYEEFDGALAVVSNITFTLPPATYAPFFETVIRYLGGLLSAHALSHDPILLARADDLGSALMPAFNTPSGLPAFSVNVNSGSIKWAGVPAAWSEVLSCQLEYKYLAYLTGRTRYYTAVERVMEIMYTANLSSSAGLFPTRWSTQTGVPSSTSISVGARADSGYEYMLKQWLLSGRTDTKARDLYLRSMNAILDNLTYVSPKRNLLYVTDAFVDPDGEIIPTHVFEHLTCFLPGVLALGAATLPDVPRTHLWAARGLANTCWMLYADSPTGLSPDEVVMNARFASSSSDGLWATHLAWWERSGGHGDPPGLRPVEPVQKEHMRDYSAEKPEYLLRPETVESFYLLWRTTGDVVWRERGWAVFEAISNVTRVEGSGFASIENVYHRVVRKLDQMPSWFLAETLKYLFLLFTDDDLLPLDRWVFNTEAHPLPVFRWSEWEMERFGIWHDTRAGRGS